MSDKPKIDIDYISNLARVALSEEEKAAYSKDLSSILGYVEKLNELDTDGIEPMAHPYPVYNVWREDKVESKMSPEKAMENAPASRQNMVIVPKVVE
ncbi:Asp-tRNA(Asn)/Glu-tRNA(Gln) amidotransferase subunit GatC [Puniceicoccaceae bacterium K14]|nr:Asp-tRNA(Asn)/Glu-tRNA(Gln) amidotransferase subunit GatC [Puniceicoccaceae bacterium K14]